MINYDPANFSGHKHCGNGYMMFLEVEGQDSTCPRLDPPLLFISKEHDMPCSPTQNFRT